MKAKLMMLLALLAACVAVIIDPSTLSIYAGAAAGFLGMVALDAAAGEEHQ